MVPRQHLGRSKFNSRRKLQRGYELQEHYLIRVYNMNVQIVKRRWLLSLVTFVSAGSDRLVMGEFKLFRCCLFVRCYDGDLKGSVSLACPIFVAIVATVAYHTLQDAAISFKSS